MFHRDMNIVKGKESGSCYLGRVGPIELTLAAGSKSLLLRACCGAGPDDSPFRIS